MTGPDWNQYASLGILQAVIDPKDELGFKNRLIDRIQWNTIRDKFQGSTKLLDFGCGTGRFARRFRELGMEYTGIDLSEKMVEAARELHPTTDYTYAHFNGREIPYDDNCFDVVFSCGVLQYVIKGENSQKILAEIKRVLTPKGRLLFIEQASRSQQTSGLGMRSLTEEDYLSELSQNYKIRSLARVRSSQLSAASQCAFRLAASAPWIFSLFLNSLSAWESRQIRQASSENLAALTYYDIFIEALVKSNDSDR
jgi:ubiquinone/menaquinone biosynthesis C-methylase UbiE